MKIETITQTVLRASEGHKLTNGIAYGSSVVLGAGDSPDNWHEITMEEYERIMEAVGDGDPDVPENIQEDE